MYILMGKQIIQLMDEFNTNKGDMNELMNE